MARGVYRVNRFSDNSSPYSAAAMTQLGLSAGALLAAEACNVVNLAGFSMLLSGRLKMQDLTMTDQIAVVDVVSCVVDRLLRSLASWKKLLNKLNNVASDNKLSCDDTENNAEMHM